MEWSGVERRRRSGEEVEVDAVLYTVLYMLIKMVKALAASKPTVRPEVAIYTLWRGLPRTNGL